MAQTVGTAHDIENLRSAYYDKGIKRERRGEGVRGHARVLV
jgi:hypothetical protein